MTKTFDTSLVDVQRSFSSTETNTSASSAKENQPPSIPTSGPHGTGSAVSTLDLYDQWAPTYDTDGNVLQAVDDLQMRDMIPHFVNIISQTTRVSGDTRPLRVLDLGCGTGRNTLRLLQASWPCAVEIVGWDASQTMLDVASQKCASAVAQSSASARIDLTLQVIDVSDSASLPNDSMGAFDGLISTLVLEHLPLTAFFGAISKVLKPGGVAVMSNMHPEMGSSTQAGFKDAAGERLRATSFVYGVQETLDAAKVEGLELIGQVREIAVSDEMIQREVVSERGRKWRGVRVWYGMMLKKQ